MTRKTNERGEMLHQSMQKKRGGDGGFTLIELLIVIIILGILAAIVVFAIGTTRKDSVASACKTDSKSIELSAEAVFTKTGEYPDTSTPTNGAPNFGGTFLLSNNTAGPNGTQNGALLKSWPGSSDYAFRYQQTGGGTGYTITISGPRVTGGTFNNVSPATAITNACKGT